METIRSIRQEHGAISEILQAFKCSYHTAFADQEQVRVNDKFVSLAVHSLAGSIWVLHVYRMPCTPSLGCLMKYVSDQYFGEVEGQSSWFELQDFALCGLW